MKSEDLKSGNRYLIGTSGYNTYPKESRIAAA